MSTSEIITICQQLKKEGKEPSVALIKSRMRGPKILPAIISGLKAWQAAPDQTVEAEETIAPQQNKNESLEQRVTELEKLVSELQVQIANLQK